MKKYFLKTGKTKREVKIGDEIKLSKTVDTPYGEGETVVTVNITEETLKKLIKNGKVEVVNSREAEKAKKSPIEFGDGYIKIDMGGMDEEATRKTEAIITAIKLFLETMFNEDE